ncbi:MAG: hypothetical protein GXO73_09785 [Calditrichaeota bacterium]|nr:hypothetical protein [Calditrichota bacterium]
MRHWWVGLAIALAMLPGQGRAQLFDNVLAANRLEYSRSTENNSDVLRDWLDTDFWAQNVRFGFRLEVVQSTPQLGSYGKITQRFVEVRQGGLRMRFGNYYEKIGQGLLFQSFELRTLVLDRIERSFVQDRNADGVWLEYRGSKFEGRLFSAQPLSPETGLRENVVRGADVDIWLTPALKLGSAAMRWYPSDRFAVRRRDFGAVRAHWLGEWLDLTSEYAWRSAAPWTKGAAAHAFYAAASLATPLGALSFEWKDYLDFNLPFNNPPPLVPTHSVALLNRHTHLLWTRDERGFQAQFTFAPAPGWSVVALANRGASHANAPDSRYHEWFLDVRYEQLGQWNLRGVLDESSDRMFGRESVRTGALEVERYLTPVWSTFVDVQVQRVRLVDGVDYWNQLVTLSVARASAYSLALQIDRSSNPAEERKVLPALIFSATLDGRHQAVLTVGSRRAGLLCSGGVCAFVPEFRGVELRLNSRF